MDIEKLADEYVKELKEGMGNVHLFVERSEKKVRAAFIAGASKVQACGISPVMESFEPDFEDNEPDYSDFDCSCGAWRWSDKIGKPIHVADCICGSSEPW